MLFNSYLFIFAFLPVVYFLYAYLRRLPDDRVATAFLLVASLIFYAIGGLFFFEVFVMTMVINITVGQGLLRVRSGRKTLLVFGIGVNLAILGYFKYAGFIADNLNTA